MAFLHNFLSIKSPRDSSNGRVPVAKHFPSWEVTGSNLLDALGVRSDMADRQIPSDGTASLLYCGCSGHSVPVNHSLKKKPNATISTTKVKQSDSTDPEEGEHLFHSQMWVKGARLHFIVNSGSRKYLISA